MRLQRITIRQLMFVIAIVAAILTAFEAGRRWERARRLYPTYVAHQLADARFFCSCIAIVRD